MVDVVEEYPITKQQFARWSFLRDQEVKLYPSNLSFEDLPNDEQEGYLEEAEYYLTEVQRKDWPDDILDRILAEVKRCESLPVK